MPIVKCQYCGSEYTVKPYRVLKTKYCSRSCASKDNYKNIVFGNDHKKGNKFRKGHKPTNAFPKGNIPWNKGLKGIHMSPETEFKKGIKSNKKLPIGSIRTRKCKRGVLRNWIKISDEKWKENHIYVWEKENGIIPNGHVVHHIDHNPLNDDIKNLQLMTRKDHINHHREDLLKGRK